MQAIPTKTIIIGIPLLFPGSIDTDGFPVCCLIQCRRQPGHRIAGPEFPTSCKGYPLCRNAGISKKQCNSQERLPHVSVVCVKVAKLSIRLHIFAPAICSEPAFTYGQTFAQFDFSERPSCQRRNDSILLEISALSVDDFASARAL